AIVIMSGQTSAIQALMHLLKSYIGSGILAMPKAFRFKYFLFGDYYWLAEKAMSEGPKCLRKYSNFSRLLTIVFLFTAQMGFCCTYYVFIAKNIKQFLINLDLEPNWGNDESIQYYLLVILPILILIITNTGKKHTTLLGNKVSQFFSTTMFTYEGITVTMGLYQSMKNRNNFAKPCGVINTAIVIVMTMYTIVGLLGYLKYGNEVEASITLSLPKEAIYMSVQLMYSIAITISYPVQLYVAIHLIWPIIDDKLQKYKLNHLTIHFLNYIFRALLVIITCQSIYNALAALIPKLELILALIGAVSCSTVAIMIPPILHTITFYELTTETFPKIWLCLRNGVIVLFGMLGFVTGTYFSVSDIIQSYSQNQMD
ncbi:unnamed protein product, partial [Medioppia subpectinata]